MKNFFLGIIGLAIVAGAIALSFFKGVETVRDGLVANYPTVKNLVQGTSLEFDTSITYTVYKNGEDSLFARLFPQRKSDSVNITVPYYCRTGIDLSVRNFRLFRDKKTVEVWLPAYKVLYCDLKFDYAQEDTALVPMVLTRESKTLLRNVLVPKIEKEKAFKNPTNLAVVKTLMFYFMPYKFDLKVYIDSEQQTLPKVPGVNQTPEEAIKEMLGQ